MYASTPWAAFLFWSCSNSANRETHQLLQGRRRGCALYQRIPGMNGFTCSPTAFLECKTSFEHTFDLGYRSLSRVKGLTPDCAVVWLVPLFAFSAFWIKVLYHLFHAWAENFDPIRTESLWQIYQVNYSWNIDVRIMVTALKSQEQCLSRDCCLSSFYNFLVCSGACENAKKHWFV